jgi:hypothetical protein
MMPFRPKKDVVVPDYFFVFPALMDNWGNATYPDCVAAEEAMNKAVGGIFVDASVVINWASEKGDLNGAELVPVVEQMNQAGFEQDGNTYGDGLPMAINFADAPTMKAAIYQVGTSSPAGELKIGMAPDQLPDGAGNNQGWILTGASPDDQEDHCMGCNGFGTVQQFIDSINAKFGLNLTVPESVEPNMQGYAVYTWATIGFFDTQTFVNIVGEALIRNPSTTISGTGTPTPDVVTVYQSSTPTPPAPIPPPPPPAPSSNPVVTAALALLAALESLSPTTAAAALASLLRALFASVGNLRSSLKIPWATVMQDLGMTLVAAANLAADIAARNWTTAMADGEAVVADVEAILALLGIDVSELKSARLRVRKCRTVGQSPYDAWLATLQADMVTLQGDNATIDKTEQAVEDDEDQLGEVQTQLTSDQTANTAALAQFSTDLQKFQSDAATPPTA